MIEGRSVVLDTSVLIAAGLGDETLHRHAMAIMKEVTFGGLRPVVAPNLAFRGPKRVRPCRPTWSDPSGTAFAR